MTIHLKAKPAGTPTWIDVMWPDAAAARTFYQAVFGWEFDIGGPEFGNYTTARLGKYTAAGIVGSEPNAQAAWNLYFATPDVIADTARAVKQGASVIAPAMVVGEFGGMATCQDPTGAMFSLWQGGQHVGAQVTDEPGSMAWCELYTPDAKKARDFYANLLGATVELMPGMEYYVLKHGEQQLCGIMQIDPSWGKMAPHWVSYFAVASADETAALVTQLGGKQMGGIDDSPFGRLAALADPAGALFKVIQPPAR